MKGIEELITRVVDSVNEEEVVSFASDIARIPSFTGEETALARWLQKFFEERGYEVEMQEVPPHKGNFQPVARLSGSGGGKDLMFNGHMDVEPLFLDCKDPWTPKRVGNRLEGWGLFNMKGGVAAMIMAAEAVRKVGVKLKGDIIVCPVVGELRSGTGTMHLIDKGVTADAAIVPEPYCCHDINTVTCGCVDFVINTKGRFALGALDSPFGGEGRAIDALQKMLKILDALNKMKMTHKPWSKVPGAPLVYCGAIRAGRGRDHSMRSYYINVDFCTAIINVCTVLGQTPDTVLKDVKRTIEKLREEDPDIIYEIEAPPDPKYYASDMYMPPIDAPIDMPIIQAIKRNYKRVTGDEIRSVGVPSIIPSDHTILYANGIPAVCIGPTGGWIHEPGVRHYQYVNIDEMVLATKVLAATAVDFCNSEK